MSKGKGIDYWIGSLSRSEIPAFSYIISEINKQCSDDESSATELAEIILKDASLTSKILKVVNSAYYNPQYKKPITTVSRAVVLLGFSGIKSILLTTMLIEHALKSKGKARVLSCLAKSIHRAVQTRFLVKHIDDVSDELLEESFIYGLVYDIAEIAFWSGNYPEVAWMEKALDGAGNNHEELQREVLGASFRQISRGLMKQWQLGSDFDEIFSPASSSTLNKSVLCIQLADELCDAAMDGWQGDNVNNCILKAAEVIGLNAEDTRVLLKDRADLASQIASINGCDELCELIPSANTYNQFKIDPVKETVADPALLLDLLREIKIIEQQTVDMNMLFHMLLECAHRGIGMERVAIFIINKASTAATLKYAVGKEIDQWQKGLEIPVSANDPNIFSHSIHQREDLWLKPDQDQSWINLISQTNFLSFDTSNALISTIYAGSRPIALLVADRGEKGCAIEESQFESYSFFSQQASQSLTVAVSSKSSHNSKKMHQHK